MKAHELDKIATRISLSDIDPNSILYRTASVTLRFKDEYKLMKDGKPVIITK